VGCLFCDDFENGVLDPNWSYIKPTWMESGGSLNGTPVARKAIAVATPIFAGCQLCCVQTTIRTAGGPFSRVWIYTQYVDKANTIELLAKEENEKWILKERVGKSVVAKAKFISTIDPGVDYEVEVCFEGTQFNVTIDGASAMILTPASTVPSGTLGFAAKNTTASFGFINVY
jgi:hypothetical protein